MDLLNGDHQQVSDLFDASEKDGVLYHRRRRDPCCGPGSCVEVGASASALKDGQIAVSKLLRASFNEQTVSGPSDHIQLQIRQPFFNGFFWSDSQLRTGGGHTIAVRLESQCLSIVCSSAGSALTYVNDCRGEDGDCNMVPCAASAGWLSRQGRTLPPSAAGAPARNISEPLDRIGKEW
jgi:hypothetical protein